MEIGSPDLFHNDLTIRINSLKRTISEYEFLSKNTRNLYSEKIDPYTTCFVKGLGNKIEFHRLFRDLFFNSRELLDFILIVLNKNFGTNREFLKFFDKLIIGDYESLNIKIIDFLKNNLTYVFHIRKVRNEIKNKPSNIKFRFVTDHIESYFSVPILRNEDERFLDFLSLKNKEEAISKRRYSIVINLDLYFPEILVFWNTCLLILKKDVKSRLSL